MAFLHNRYRLITVLHYNNALCNVFLRSFNVFLIISMAMILIFIGVARAELMTFSQSIYVLLICEFLISGVLRANAFRAICSKCLNFKIDLQDIRDLFSSKRCA